MDFITGLPNSRRKFDSIWVIVDRLTKSAHFLPVRTTYSAEDYTRLYIKEIVWLHGVPLSIISDRDNRRRDLEFAVGDWVFLKVSPMKGVMTFGKKGKLSPKYVGPYHIVQRIGRVADKLDLHPELGAIHPVFYVSMLRKFLGDPSCISPIEDIQVTKDLSYEEIPVAILDLQIRKLRTKEVASLKVLWRNNNVEEMTWEAEEDMKSRYPHLFEFSGDMLETNMESIPKAFEVSKTIYNSIDKLGSIYYLFYTWESRVQIREDEESIILTLKGVDLWSRSANNLLSLDPEIERALHRVRREVEARTRIERELDIVVQPQPIEMAGNAERAVIEAARTNLANMTQDIVKPEIIGHFELK
ncbi:uncharacterized protein [Nicotiana sylvestris]|uniref:uncharacterized protein n=1 Tax=Nicotiana sylvestris TaxID=4096 RepID=UPI00388CC71B